MDSPGKTSEWEAEQERLNSIFASMASSWYTSREGAKLPALAKSPRNVSQATASSASAAASPRGGLHACSSTVQFSPLPMLSSPRDASRMPAGFDLRQIGDGSFMPVSMPGLPSPRRQPLQGREAVLASRRELRGFTARYEAQRQAVAREAAKMLAEKRAAREAKERELAAQPRWAQVAEYAPPPPAQYMRSKWDREGAGNLKASLKDLTLIDAGWLADLAATADGRLPRCQEVPEVAKVSLAQMEKWGGEMLGVLVVSCPWLEDEHPDPGGEYLKRVAFVLRAFAMQAKIYHKTCSVGVYWDYCSVPQRSRHCAPDGDDRTRLELATYERAMRGRADWLSNAQTHVLLVNNQLPFAGKPRPDLSPYTNKRPWNERAWCIADQRMACLCKEPTGIIDFTKLSGREISFSDVVDHQPAKPVPLSPLAFGKVLEQGLADGSICFPKLVDLKTISEMYHAAFEENTHYLKAHREAAQLTSVVDPLVQPTLHYGYQNWGDEGCQTLATTLMMAVGPNGLDGGIARADGLHLMLNKIGDGGIAALSHAFANGALAQASYLYLEENLIGDEGLKHLSEALAGGALPELTELLLASNRIGNAGALAFADALGKGGCKKVRLLALGGNRIGTEGMLALSEAMAHGGLPELRDLSLPDNKIGNKGLEGLRSALAAGAIPKCTEISLKRNAANSTTIALVQMELIKTMKRRRQKKERAAAAAQARADEAMIMRVARDINTPRDFWGKKNDTRAGAKGRRRSPYRSPQREEREDMGME